MPSSESRAPTRLPNQQKEPHTPRQVYHQRQCISWALQEVYDRKKGFQNLLLQPAI